MFHHPLQLPPVTPPHLCSSYMQRQCKLMQWGMSTKKSSHGNNCHTQHTGQIQPHLPLLHTPQGYLPTCKNLVNDSHSLCSTTCHQFQGITATSSFVSAPNSNQPHTALPCSSQNLSEQQKTDALIFIFFSFF